MVMIMDIFGQNIVVMQDKFVGLVKVQNIQEMEMIHINVGLLQVFKIKTLTFLCYF